MLDTLSHVDALQRAGSVVWENRWYGGLYVVDRTSLTKMLAVCIPVLHLGQVEAVNAVTGGLATQWVTAWLWCPRDVAVRRIAERGTGDAAARLRAWDETEPMPGADVSVNTAEFHPADAAAAIHSRVQVLLSGKPLR